MIRALDRATAVRLGRTLSANAYGQVVTIAVQLALVPLLLHAWGTQVYGAWLLLSAIPFYLTFSDFGFTFVAKNAMVMAVAGGRRDAARAIFQSIFALLCVAAPVLMVSSLAATFLPAAVRLLPATTVGLPAARVTLLLLIANVLLYQFFLLICAGIRSENRPASEAVWAASARLAEGAAVALAALGGGGIMAAAGAMLFARVLFLLGGYHWLRRRSAWLRLGLTHARRATLAPLCGPALAYMMMPLAQALLLQGTLLVVGATLGTAATVVFATSRTVARLGTAGINMINNSVVREYAALEGAGKRSASMHLFRAQARTTVVLTAGYALAVLSIAPLGLPLLTHGTVTVVQPFFAFLVAAVVAEMLWSALFTPMAAVNRHRGIVQLFVLLAAGAVAAAYLAAVPLGLSGIAGAVGAAHAAMVGVCLVAWRRDRG